MLIHYVAAIDGVDRVRFTTSHPVEFSRNLIDAFGEVPELARFSFREFTEAALLTSSRAFQITIDGVKK